MRLYEVRINNQELSVSQKIYDTTILPFLFVIPNGKSEVFSAENIDSVILGETYLLSIKSYTCFHADDKNLPISCTKKAKSKYENYDTSYKKMQIWQYSYDEQYTYSISTNHLSRSYYVSEHSIKTRPCEDYSVLYDGNYINDLTSYFSQKGVYVVRVSFKYSGTKGMISFGIVNDGEKIFAL